MNQDIELQKAKKILKESKTIAIVGFSNNHQRASYNIAQYLKEHYKVIGVNPNARNEDSIAVYPSVAEAVLKEKIDCLNVFRKAEYVLDIVKEAEQYKIPFVWLQEGIISQQAYNYAKEHNIVLVMDMCIAVMHSRFKEELGH